MNRGLLTTLALCALLAGCADASKEPEPPANSEQLPAPVDPSGGTAGMGEGQQDPAATSSPTGNPPATVSAPGASASDTPSATPPDSVVH
jgi:hypothetical protein